MRKTLEYLCLFAIILNTTEANGVKVGNKLENYVNNIKTYLPKNIIENAAQSNFYRKARSVHSVLPPVINDCAKAKDYLGAKYTDGVYQLNLPGFQPINATCVTKCSPSNSTRCCTWTVIIRNHESAKGTFQRSYNEFKVGFGNSSTDYFIGLDRLHAMTKRAPQSLLIIDFTAHKEVFLDEFYIKNEKSNYQISGIKGHAIYIGAAVDYNMGEDYKFYVDGECALKHNRGWWYPSRLCSIYTFTTSLSNDFIIALEPQNCRGEGVWDEDFEY